jgi:hypothetical protein
MGIHRALDDDYWLYQVLQKGLVKSPTAPKIDAARLAGLLKPVEGKSWSAEISGRALSLAVDIRTFANKRAATNISLKFRHLLDIAVTEVRKLSACDVYLTPNGEDPAHSDLTYDGPIIVNEIDSYTIPHDTLRTIAETLSKAMTISDPNAAGGLDRIEGLRPNRSVVEAGSR